MDKNKNLMSVYELLKEASLKYGDQEVIYDLKQRFSYKQLKNDVDYLAGGLKRKGIVKGDRVAVSLPNWYENVVVLFAIAKIGAIVVPFSPKYKSFEVERILKNAEPKLLIATEEFEHHVTFKKALTLVPEAITVRCVLEGLESYEDLMNTGMSAEEVTIDVNEDLFCLLYTSGTTGVPKGVMVPHRALVGNSAYTIGSELYCNEEDVFLIAAPLFHIFGMAVNLFCAVAAGARIVLIEKYHPQLMLEMVQQEKVTIHSGVPTMFIKELEVDHFDSYDLSSLRAGIVGASPIPANKVKEIRDRFGMNLCQSFGITETCSVTITPYDDDEKYITETLGKALPGVEMKIVDENRLQLPPGETGEIAIKGFGNMKGYYKMPEQTKAITDDEGWYYSGDLGTMDENGYLRFIGRQKEMIIRGGLNIYPQEIEAVLTKHRKVMDVAIIGLPDEIFGEIVCAVIQLKEGKESSEEEIITYLKERIATHKLPSKVVFTQEFPVTASGKIQKMKLKERVTSEITIG
ncbi:class I adenylate-forming enzyme family protein [Niallia oryzisoli]|uniref:Class I adenylate-forming enzyme family protein n=1 Tax=Niallia oryzisoli TaxID=1737571 RepID=A0ABZ2CF95_9BACI